MSADFEPQKALCSFPGDNDWPAPPTITSKSKVQIFTDSKYLKDGIENWIHKWKINNWKTTTKKPVKNKDLWLKLDEAIYHHNIKWNWVKGHSDNQYNEKADGLARKYIEENIY